MNRVVATVALSFGEWWHATRDLPRRERWPLRGAVIVIYVGMVGGALVVIAGKS